jgi:hypothetical protein
MTNSINQKPSAADMLTRQIAAARRRPESLDDSFAQAIGRKLESRGIARVPGLSDEPEDSTWVDAFLEYGRKTRELQEEWEARRKAEEEAAQAPQTTAGYPPRRHHGIIRPAAVERCGHPPGRNGRRARNHQRREPMRKAAQIIHSNQDHNESSARTV